MIAKRSKEIFVVSSSVHLLSPLHTIRSGQSIANEVRTRSCTVVSGAFRVVHYCLDGRARILAFYLPGDVVVTGEEIGDLFSFEAIGTVNVRSARFDAQASIAQCAEFSRLMLTDIVDMIGSTTEMSAVKRVAWFVSKYYHRFPPIPGGTGFREFIIPRSDIANYLGLTIETVCRSLAELHWRELIVLPTRKAIGCDAPDALRRFLTI